MGETGRPNVKNRPPDISLILLTSFDIGINLSYGLSCPCAKDNRRTTANATVSMTDPRPTSNRRRGPRRRAQSGVRLSCVRGLSGLGPNLARSLLDVSECGARLLARSAVDPGREVEVSLQGPAEQRPHLHRGSVAWCVPAANGEFILGVRFQHYLSYEQLGRLA